MKNLFNFIKLLPKFYNLYKKYNYTPRQIDKIITNFFIVLTNRTKSSSNIMPLDYWDSILEELDKWYVDIIDDEEWK